MSIATEFGSFRHLAVRFFGALSSTPPSTEDEEWALSHLVEGERDLYRRMSPSDQRHALSVARQAVALRPEAGVRRAFVAAALLHDVGKIDARFGPVARALVTLTAIAAGRRRLVRLTRACSERSTLARRVHTYLRHDTVGSAMLQSAGSDELTWTWAQEHHLPSERWTVDHGVAVALKTADGD